MRIKVNTTSTCAFMYIYFATKTVHIKLAIDFSIDALLNYLKKFITHQGLCHDICLDNEINLLEREMN